MAIFQQQPIVTDRPFVALQNHSQHVPPYQFQRGGGEGGGPPPLKSIPFQLKSIPWGGGGHIDSINLFGGGGGGEGGGWRALSFDKSILSRGQINFQPTPIFVNKNSSFALPELAFVTCSNLLFEPLVDPCLPCGGCRCLSRTGPSASGTLAQIPGNIALRLVCWEVHNSPKWKGKDWRWIAKRQSGTSLWSVAASHFKSPICFICIAVSSWPRTSTYETLTAWIYEKVKRGSLWLLLCLAWIDYGKTSSNISPSPLSAVLAKNGLKETNLFPKDSERRKFDPWIPQSIQAAPGALRSLRRKWCSHHMRAPQHCKERSRAGQLDHLDRVSVAAFLLWQLSRAGTPLPS